MRPTLLLLALLAAPPNRPVPEIVLSSPLNHSDQNHSDSPPSPSPSLYHAIRNNNVPAVLTAIDHHDSTLVNRPLSDGITPLHLAVVLGHDDIAQVLLLRGAHVGPTTIGGFTPLHWAAGRDAFPMGQLLIKRGADVSAMTANGITPLHWAANNNATNMTSLLIAAGANMRATTETGMTPLHWATLMKAREAATMLAYAIATAEMSAAEEAPAPRNQRPREPRYKTATRRIAPALPRPVPGSFLRIPLGRDEQLDFVWIAALEMWVGKYEISNSQYRRFNARHSSRSREGLSLDGPDHPAVRVSWEDAEAYCRWMNANFGFRIPVDWVFRLPTADEWTAAARCGDKRRYPWGNGWPPSVGNIADETTQARFPNVKAVAGYNDQFAATCPIYLAGANEWGLFGMGGNAWEWCGDWYAETGHTHKVRHGGSWDYAEESGLRINTRGFDLPTTRDDTIGLRLVVAPDQ